MQTILGGGGAIGSELAKQLTKYTNRIRIVNRNPQRVNASDELFQADLLIKDKVFEAIQGSSIVYVTIGFEYNLNAWQKQWPEFIRNVIDACSQYNSKLVFFDNIYMYDKKYLGNLTEETPVNPVSKKGIVRARVADLITSAFQRGDITALIARSADFYGPNNDKSSMNLLIIDNLKKGRPAIWFVDADKIHSYTYTPDAAIAVALLGNTNAAYNQIWHLPTSGEKLTGRQWSELIAKQMGIKPRLKVIPKIMIGSMSLFMPLMKELKEMLYQYEEDYFFNSSKFCKYFNYKPVTHAEGLAVTIGEHFVKTIPA